jgi:DNA mismatch repair ATPase MutS
MSLSSTYQERIKQFEADFKVKEATTNRISTFRIAVFLLLLVAIIQYISSNFEAVIWLFIFLGTIPVFAYLVKWHQRIFDEKALLEQLLIINQKEYEIQTNYESSFDGGEEFADPMHDYASDLDLFGEGGLFSFINRTSTARGKENLAALLKQPHEEIETVEAYQEAIKELTPKLDFRQNFMAQGYLTEDTLEDLDYLNTWVKTPAVFRSSMLWKTIRIVLPLITLSTLVYYMITFNHLPLLLMVFVNLCLLGVQSKYIGQEHTFIGKKQEILKMYISLLHLAQQENFKSSDLLKDFNQNAAQAEGAFNKLISIISYFDQRLNILVGLGLNLLILYDLQCLFALEKWKADYNNYLEQWILSVAKLDVFVSISNFACNNPEFNFPHLTFYDQNKIVAKDLGHPLIPATQRINNDCSLGADGKSVFVVTGSNMAGKSTFLRSVAINLLLARIGAPVCATTFEANPMNIITSMRVQDSISKNTSYFQAELQRMQYIVQTLDKGKPTFVILDEILKGTNSDDKLLGSQLLVKRFINLNCISMIATHDLDLGNMQEVYPTQVENLCFESKIENDLLSFDYKLNRGIAKNKNATFLMYQMEIVPKED